jgi:CDGSH-type Zn-finger protein
MEKVRITINNNGSIRIEGDVELVDATGKAFGLGGRTTFSLCRCGLSSKKPFCDGAHKSGGFQDVCQAYDLPPKQ